MGKGSRKCKSKPREGREEVKERESEGEDKKQRRKSREKEKEKKKNFFLKDTAKNEIKTRTVNDAIPI